MNLTAWGESRLIYFLVLSVLHDSFIVSKKKWNFFQFEVWFQCEFQEYCGDVKLVFSADVDRTVNERYENNNEIEIPVTIHCPNGKSYLYDLFTLRVPGTGT